MARLCVVGRRAGAVELGADEVGELADAALPQKSMGAVTSFVFSSCDFVDRSLCPENKEIHEKHEPISDRRSRGAAKDL